MLIIIHGAAGLRLHNSVLDGNTSSKAVFVHIPKIAGTALTETLHVLSDMTGVVAHDCGVSQHALQSCFPLTEQAFQVMSGQHAVSHFQISSITLGMGASATQMYISFFLVDLALGT